MSQNRSLLLALIGGLLFTAPCPQGQTIQNQRGGIMRHICEHKYEHPERITPAWRRECERHGFVRT